VTSEDLSPELGALLASLTELPPSNDPAAVVAAALAARPAAPLQPPPAHGEVAAFSRAVDDVQHTLRLLSNDDWDRPAVNGLTVGELVGHLIGTQLEMMVGLGLEEAGIAATDHIEATREAIVAGAAMGPVAAADEFARASTLLLDHIAELDARDLDQPATFGPITADVRFVLLVRIFELWTHDNDLRGAVGLHRVEPDPDRLWMMTRAVMPLVATIGGDHLRVVLTGTGGGVWPADGSEIGEIVVDAVDFCRRVANRMPLDELHADLAGDVATAENVLQALATLALD
jgi:uncharacterized protein (TIGR03083 family)